MNYRNNALELYHMFYLGKPLEAFEKYYHNDVVMIASTGEIREGKEKNREYRKQFFASISEIHDGGVEGITVDEKNGITMVESWLEVSLKDGRRIRIEEVARQSWEGNQVTEEKFYGKTITLSNVSRPSNRARLKGNKRVPAAVS